MGTFASLLLHDEGMEISADNINKVLNNTGNKVTAYWPMLVAQALAGRNMGDMLTVSGGGNAPQAQTSNAPVEEVRGGAKKEEKKEEEEEEEEGGFGDMFD